MFVITAQTGVCNKRRATTLSPSSLLVKATTRKLQSKRRTKSMEDLESTEQVGEQDEARHQPTVVILGRPNVGKSTLFNRLTGSRRSIVGDEPGITRDRIYGRTQWNGREFKLVDTGGIIPNDAELIPANILRQARAALEEAALILLVTDARAGI